jgi:hypothetical protein
MFRLRGFRAVMVTPQQPFEKKYERGQPHSNKFVIQVKVKVKVKVKFTL